MRSLLLVPFLVLAGCGGGLGTHEGVLDAQIDAMDDFADILDGINNKSDVDSAKPKVEALVKRMQEIQTAADKLGEPTGDQKKQLEKKMQDAQKKFEPRMKKVQERLQNDPEAMQALFGLIMEVSSKMEPR